MWPITGVGPQHLGTYIHCGLQTQQPFPQQAYAPLGQFCTPREEHTCESQPSQPNTRGVSLVSV